MPPIKLTAAARARAEGYRSGLEVRTSKALTDLGIPFGYETVRLPYLVPSRKAHYTPDYALLHNGIVVETKGRWMPDDRKKTALIREQFPDLDLRLVFSNPLTPISKGSKTTYSMVAAKLGIPFAKETIPREWLNEPPNEASLALIRQFTK